ncbi:energy transducer TonB [Pedobacter africanus]|uniref:Outer membrane transport energization protein TonB n=1 Tax=Pedobacter africanus TaxID=151894 RepID=A0A1W2CH52_9SPHI|nr:energy transducer TonB [Pedobacter africanus]SMC84529.1 outer membrane transport energization protein TonB [Pedobacter africanus]
MLGSKIDLSGNQWLEIVFNQKNKSYGAYALRRQSASDTSKALFIAGSLFILFFLSPKLISLVKGSDRVDDTRIHERVVEVQPPPALNPETPPPAVIEPPAPKQNQIKFLPPVVVEDDKVDDLDPVQLKDLAIANPGQKTVEGQEDGQLVITETPGIGKEQVAAAGDDVYPDFRALEVQPDFPGGMDKFYKYLSKAIRFPAAAQEANISGKVFLSFIIEKNGTLTDIKVERKLGYGTDEEAVRVLTGSPKWMPGIQNGKAVRVKYNIPINFSLAQ